MFTLKKVALVKKGNNMPIKNILSSKTMWLNAIAFVLMLVALPQFISVLPASTIPFVALITAILNGVLRLFFTNTPITQIAANQTPPG